MISTHTDDRSYRQRAAARIDRLLDVIDWPIPFTTEALCESLARQRNRPIHLTPLSQLLEGRLPPWSGLWIPAPDADWLLYDDSTAEVHQANSIYHELGHMLLGHDRGDALDDADRAFLLEILHALMPSLSPDVLRTLIPSTHGRGGHDSPMEWEAELFATRLWQRATQLDTVAPRTGPDGPALDRLEGVLCSPPPAGR